MNIFLTHQLDNYSFDDITYIVYLDYNSGASGN